VGDGDAATLLRRALALRDTLLVLDNCEHLISDVAHIAATALDGAPKLRLLATSLESLKLPGEQIFRLDALAVPPAPMPLELARCFGAIQLLEQRAQAVDQRFRLSESSVSQAIDLCRQLDGIALAIEMAAARLPVLGFDALAAHLGDRLGVLRNASRGAPARHQTLGATLEWSHSLLADDERNVLRRLAVFVGSFRLDAALAVATAGGMDESAVLDALFGLVDKSMLKIIQLEPPRYRLLESTRLYAAQRLEHAGEGAAAMQRHSEAMAKVAVELDALYGATPDRELLRRFMADYDDLQIAYERACAAGWVAAAVDISAALTMLRNLRVIGAGRHKRLKSAAQLLPLAQGATRAKLLGLFANTYVSTIQEVSRADAARELVALRRELGDAQRLYEALGAQAAVGVIVGDLQTATRAVSEGRQLEQASWPPRLRAQFTFHSGNVCKELGDIAGCSRAMQDVLELSSRAGFDHGVWLAQLGLADAALLANDVPLAIDICRQAMDTLHRLDIACAWAQAAAELGAAQLMARQVEDATQSLRKAQPILEVGEGEGLILSHVAVLCVLIGRPTDAARLLGCSDAWYAANQSRPNSTVAKLNHIASAEIAAVLGSTEFTRLRAVGAAMNGDAAYALARAVIGA
jgi:predicted ATPase